MYIFQFAGNAISWVVNCVSVVGLYRKNRSNRNKVSSRNGSDLDKHLQSSKWTSNKANTPKECCEAPTSSSRPTSNLQMEMLKASLEGVCQQLQEIKEVKESEKRAQELHRRETRRRIAKLEKKSKSGFFD